jgi:hypothetical protein
VTPKHTRIGNDDMALFHYLAIPYNQRRSGTWNNLGVIYDRLKFPARSVESYRLAASRDHSLAMNNLAAKFISVGFIKEAQEECDRALKIEDFHENVGRSISRIKEIPKEETEKAVEVLKIPRKKSDFYRQFGLAVTRQMVSIKGQWQGPDCVLEIVINGNELAATGGFEKSAGLLAAVLPGSGIKHRVEYSVSLAGAAMIGRVSRYPEGQPPKRLANLLKGDENDPKILMMLADNNSNREIKVMEIPAGSPPQFYRLAAI